MKRVTGHRLLGRLLVADESYPLFELVFAVLLVNSMTPAVLGVSILLPPSHTLAAFIHHPQAHNCSESIQNHK